MDGHTVFINMKEENMKFIKTQCLSKSLTMNLTRNYPGGASKSLNISEYIPIFVK